MLIFYRLSIYGQRLLEKALLLPSIPMAKYGYSPAVGNKAKPLITANLVTSIRLLVMPAMTWLLYQHPQVRQSMSFWWWALIVGTLVSCTDFVDGFLARKYGPTVLGGMLDPLADKVFVALVYLPLMHIGFVPAWAVGLLFIREFLVTSIRSAYEWRGLQLKTSYFGKVKTWIQMQGILTLMLVVLVSKDTLLIILVASAILPALAVAALWFSKKIFHTSSALGVFFAIILLAFFVFPDNVKTGIDLTMYMVCAITWMSGFDYLAGAIPALHKAGGFHRADIVRVLAAITIPVSATCAMMYTDASAIPVLAVVALELAVGGLDNLLSRHKAGASFLSFSTRTIGSSALLFLCLLLPSMATPLAWAAMAISLAGVAHEFWHGKEHYLDDSKWDEQLIPTD